jgi:hypothetical protein
MASPILAPIPTATQTFLSRRDLATAGLVLVLCFWTFRHVPMQQSGGDSRYSMLLAENLLRHRDFTLERYDLPRPDYRLEDVGGHRYYTFPVGTSVLSVPYLLVMHLRGESVVRGDGSYGLDAESRLEVRLAAFLMAALAGIIYLTARLRLPVSWSLAVAFLSVFGTQIVSTLSQTTWSDTWGVFLVGLAAFLLFESATRDRAPNLPLLATLEVWSYIVRPTNALGLAGTAVYLALTVRRRSWPFLLTAGVWLALFVAYSWRHFHRLVPAYYQAGRLTFRASPSALLGNLVSPSRGLLICVPLVVAAGLLLIRHRRTIRFRALLGLCLFVMVGHLAMLSAFDHWWGGHCFGARLTASLVPWIVLLEIMALDAVREGRQRGDPRAGDSISLAIAGVLSLLSIGINSVGAFSREAWNWSVNPNIDETPERLWSWQRPQFLAPFVEPAGPFLPLPAEGLRFGAEESARYLGLGWSGVEGESRWTDGSHATIRFARSGSGPGLLELEARPYLGGGKLGGQRLVISLNGQILRSLTLDRPELANYEVAIPAEALRPDNRLRLEMPGAARPEVLEKTGDYRDLGIAVRTLRWLARDGAGQ